jgi:hypothetical protein
MNGHDRIRCRDTGSTGIEYRYKDQLGAPLNGQISAPIDSLNGYDPRTAAIITGVTGNGLDLITRVFIPHHSPRREHPAGDDLVRLAPIAVYDNEFGSLKPIGALAADYRDVHGEFADLESGQVLSYLSITKMDMFVSDNALDGREIASVTPPNSTADALAWHEDGEGIGQVTYRLHDPYSQDKTALNSFFAGLLASVGAAALLLLLEQVLARASRRASQKSTA